MMPAVGLLTKHCENCAASMQVYPSKYSRKRFCSRTCLGVWRSKNDPSVSARLDAIRPRTIPTELTQEILQSLMMYDAGSGVFTWLERRGGTSNVNGQAGGVQKNGYVSIAIGNRRYLAHRLAWLYVHGSWPTHQIDHINGDRSDNRLSNLRPATNQENQANRKYARSSSGYKGVSWDTERKKWVAQIHHNGKGLFLGRHESKAAAKKAYMKKAIELFGEFASDGVRVENAKVVSDA